MLSCTGTKEEAHPRNGIKTLLSLSSTLQDIPPKELLVGRPQRHSERSERLSSDFIRDRLWVVVCLIIRSSSPHPISTYPRLRNFHEGHCSTLQRSMFGFQVPNIYITNADTTSHLHLSPPKAGTYCSCRTGIH